MGIFNITPRSERLASAPSAPVRQVSMPSHHVADTSAKWRGANDLGRGMADLGQSLFAIAADMAHERNVIEDNETEAAFVDAMREKMDAPETGLISRVASAGSSEALTGCVEEGNAYFKDSAETLLTDRGYTGGRKRKMLLRLREASMPYQRSMTQGVLRKTTELKVSAADRDFSSLLETWNSRMADEDSTRSVIDSFRASQRVRGLADDAVDANTEKVWQSMAYDYVAKSVKAAGRPQLDYIEKHLDEKDAGDLFAFNPVLGGHFEGRDPLGGSVGHRSGGSVSARDGIKTAILARRRELDQADDKAVDFAANLGTASVAAIRDKDGKYPEGRLQNVEKSIEALSKLSKSLPQGGHAATDAAARASDLEAKADMIAQQEMIEAYLGELDKDPNAKIYVGAAKDAGGAVVAEARNSYFGQGRKERLAPLVQQMVDRQRGQPASQVRRARVAELKMRMLSGARNPGEYHNEVFQAAKSGEIGLSDYQMLTKEFDESWAKGFEAGKKSPKQTCAEGMLAVVQEFFPSTTLGKSYEWDDKTATMKLRKDAEYEGLKYEVRDRGGFWRDLGDLYEIPSTFTTHRIDATGVEKIVNVATQLSFYDGKQIDFDPITGGDTDFFTGEKLKTGRDAPKFSATNYFRKYMQRLADVDRATDAAEYIMRLVEAESRVTGSFLDQESRRTGEIASAARAQGRSVVQIKNGKTGEGVTSARK